MTCELTNFTVWGKQWFADGWQGLQRFCRRHALAGVELLASGADSESAPPADLIVGVHLASLGDWLSLPRGGGAAGTAPGTPPAEACCYEELVHLRAAELRAVAGFSPRYAVWHAAYTPRVGHAPLPDAEFLLRLARLVRDVTDEFTPPFRLCFENAYGPSLHPEDPSGVAAFLGSLQDLPVGLCLDLGHHLNRHRELATPEAATAELGRLAQGLGQAGLATTVLHLHWTPPALVPGDLPAAEQDPGDYFARSDQHHPLCSAALAAAVAQLAPEVVVHEMGAMSLAEHDDWLARQTASLRGTPYAP